MNENNMNYVNTAEVSAAQPPANGKPKTTRLNVPNLLVGLLVVALAAFGVFRLVQIGVNYFKDRSRDLETIEAGEYYAYLVPAAAVDIEPFEDLSVADMRELVEMTVWGVLNSGLDPTAFQYDSDTLLIPEEQVAAAFVRYFGTERPIQHMTVSGYGYEFTYDAAAHTYKIPLTTIMPAYAPVITETETRGDAVVFTVGYLNTGLYAQNPLTGEITAPEPDKYVKITVRNASAGAYISAVRSLGQPETAVTAAQDAATTAPQTPDTAESSGDTEAAEGDTEAPESDTAEPPEG